MAVAKLKPPPADPLRVQLQEAIEAAAEAKETLARHQQAITRTRTAKWQAEKSHEVAIAGVEKAIAQHAESIAAAGGADADDVAPSSSLVRMSRLAVIDAADEVESFRGAYERLRADLSLWQADADRAAAEVEGAISAVLAPIAEQLLAKLRELRAEAAPYYSLLAGLIESHLVQAVGSAGQRPLEAQLAAAMAPGGDVSVASAPWAAARSALKADASANIDGLLALPTSPPRPPAA